MSIHFVRDREWGYKLADHGGSAASNYAVSLFLRPSNKCIGHYFDPESALQAAQAIGSGKYELVIDADWIGRTDDPVGTAVDTIRIYFDVVIDDNTLHPFRRPADDDESVGGCLVYAV